MKRRGESPILVLLLLISIAILSLGLIVNLALPVVLPFIEKKIVEPLTNHNEEFVQDDNSADSFSDGECILNLVYWEAYGKTTLSSDKNSDLNLVVEAENCSNAVLTFEVFYENGTLASRLGQASFANGKFFKTWKAGNGPQYYFKVYGGGGALNLRSPKLTILLPEIPECSDGLDNDLDGFIDYPADLDCLSLTDDSESEEIVLNDSEACAFEYGNDFSNPRVCDIGLMLQGRYSELDLDYLGMNTNKAISISQTWFCDAQGMTLDEILDCTYEDIQEDIIYWRDNVFRGEISENVILLVDIENKISPSGLNQYDSNITLMNQVADAIKLRHDAIKGIFPNNPIVAWNVVRLSDTGQVTSFTRRQMDAYELMGERGVYDNLSYFTPNVYFRFGESDSNFMTYEAMTRSNIENSISLTRSDGRHLPLAVLTSLQVFNSGGSDHDRELVNSTIAAHQFKIFQEYPQIKKVFVWSGMDTGTTPVDGFVYDLPNYLESTRPVPKECICPTTSN